MYPQKRPHLDEEAGHQSAIHKNENHIDNSKPQRERSTLISHNVIVEGHRTSVRLEKEMWLALKQIARRENCTVHQICTVVSQRKKPDTSLTAAIRVFIMAYFQAAATDEGHNRAGHGRGPTIVGDVLSRHQNTPYYGLREFKTLNNSGLS